MNSPTINTPLVYSCSGCSAAGQLANQLAVRLDRMALAEMSCIAGVGGHVKKLVRVAQSGRKIIAIDGCPLACVKSCLSVHNIVPDQHIQLDKWGIAKNSESGSFNSADEDRMMNVITESLCNVV